jgi:TolB-like protein/cytochrome c-type biogenesis protein CcmH/NrfG
VTEPSHAVFLSYASQDAEAAQKICEALRAAGIEVFLDQSELRGGDAWDQKIRREIHDCALFIPVISANAASRHEGYFRLEWDLADQRTHMIARSRVFVVPVCLDATAEVAADVPESFQRVQWTRLPGGETPPAFVERIKRLLSPELSPMSAVSGATPATREPLRASRRSKPVLLAFVAAVVVFAALAYFVADKFWISKHLTPAPTAFNPPPHSIAVLPFVNLSGDKEQEYFSDGLSDELINLLTKIPDLRVTSRTSSFFFKGKSENLATIAEKLHVAHLLEGSVRKSGHLIRVSAQLITADTGYDVWSQTYDRDLKDIFQVQDDIAGEVAQAMKVALNTSLSDAGVKESNLAVYDLFLLGNFYLERHTQEDTTKAIDYYQKAIRLDPNYVRAWNGLADAYSWQAGYGWIPSTEAWAKCREAAEQVIKIDPNNSGAHSILAAVMISEWNWKGAQREIARARELDPTSPWVLLHSAWLAGSFGRLDEAIDLYRQILARDPLNTVTLSWLANSYYDVGRLEESAEMSRQVLQLSPTYGAEHTALGLTYLRQGRKEDALAQIEKETDIASKLIGETFVFRALGREAESDAALKELVDKFADGSAYNIARLYADRGETDVAFKWLERSRKQHESDLTDLKVEPELRSLHGDSRFQALLVKLNLVGDRPE